MDSSLACLSGLGRHSGVSQPPLVFLCPLPQTREKEKMKEAKDARYTNGHLFTTISVSGMTMCYACNKSITAKEALICPSKLDPECHSDSHLSICPFCSGSIGVTPHAEPQLGPLLPCLPPRGGGSRTMAQAGLSGNVGEGRRGWLPSAAVTLWVSPAP